MKESRIAEPVWKRSVLRRIKNRREEVVSGAATGLAGNLLDMGAGRIVASAEAGFLHSLQYGSDRAGRILLHRAVNACAAMGAKPVAVQVQLLCPIGFEEPELRRLMDVLEEEAKALNVSLLPGRIECSLPGGVPYLSLNALGRADTEYQPYKNVRAGQDLVVSKWIALEATINLADQYREEFLKRFTPVFVDRAQGFFKYISSVPEAAAAVRYASVMLSIEEGGIFGALWELAEGAHLGLEVFAGDIPVKQETIELCELYRKNPYELPSAGSLLIAAEKGEQLCRELCRLGIPAAVIGHLTEGNDRVLLHGEEKRFLDLPKRNEI